LSAPGLTARAIRSRVSCFRPIASSSPRSSARRTCAPCSKLATADALDAIAFRAAGQPLGDALMGAGGLPLHVAGHLTSRHLGRARERSRLQIDDVADPRKVLRRAAILPRKRAFLCQKPTLSQSMSLECRGLPRCAQS
jgi:hypothetical protein